MAWQTARGHLRPPLDRPRLARETRSNDVFSNPTLTVEWQETEAR
jgi:hypothetical protein